MIDCTLVFSRLPKKTKKNERHSLQCSLPQISCSPNFNSKNVNFEPSLLPEWVSTDSTLNAGTVSDLVQSRLLHSNSQSSRVTATLDSETRCIYSSNAKLLLIEPCVLLSGGGVVWNIIKRDPKSGVEGGSLHRTHHKRGWCFKYKGGIVNDLIDVVMRNRVQLKETSALVYGSGLL